LLKISNIKIKAVPDFYPHLIKKTAGILKIDNKEIKKLTVLKKSIDARKKDILYVFTVAVSLSSEIESKILSAGFIQNLSVYKDHEYSLPYVKRPGERPLVVGDGPAGLFAAFLLTLSGIPPLVIERGKRVEERTCDIEEYFKTGSLDPDSNVQFGEGGAGAFSDGKLNTQVNDRFRRNDFVLKSFVKFGADPDILIDPRPHVGTDSLYHILSNMRNFMEEKGCEFRFSTALTGIITDNGRVTGAKFSDGSIYSCDRIVLAIGHSARDTFEELYRMGIPMCSKQFAMGFRIEHPQDFIDRSQYGKEREFLPAAYYRLSANLPDGRGVYSFCMCPGGYVIDSSSEEGAMCVNGMSYRSRDSKNANSAIVISVGQKEFDLNDPMGALKYQRKIERKAYSLGKGKIPQQLLGDFKKRIVTKSYGSFESLVKGRTSFSDMSGLFSEEITRDFINGISIFDKKIKGFGMDDAILSGVESRTSSPVRIMRDDTFQSTGLIGLYPAGEGAGYAGGIMSAAMDGMKIAERIISEMN
jgi:uncharacterized FAD-dependent dehydrogenase